MVNTFIYLFLLRGHSGGSHVPNRLSSCVFFFFFFVNKRFRAEIAFNYIIVVSFTLLISIKHNAVGNSDCIKNGRLANHGKCE